MYSMIPGFKMFTSKVGGQMSDVFLSTFSCQVKPPISFQTGQRLVNEH
mgnify:CR=1 FL=1